MCVNLFCLVLVQTNESVQNVIAGHSVIFSTFVIREVVLHWADRQLLLETIDLVQEKNYRGLDKPSGIADRVKEGKRFLHSVDSLIFEEKLVVFGNGNKEKDGSNVLEAMNPLLSFRSLSTYIEHAVGEVTNNKCCLGDTSGLDTRPENILIIWHIIRLRDTLNIIKVAR